MKIDEHIGYEQVHAIWDYHDGPRQGVADFRGVPHVFRCIFDKARDRWSTTFELHPIDPETLALVVKDRQIWIRWRRAFEAGRVSIDTHPHLPEYRVRHDQVTARLSERLVAAAMRSFTAAGTFRRIGDGTTAPDDEAGWEVRWSPGSA
jgi:hypothetical protein